MGQHIVAQMRFSTSDTTSVAINRRKTERGHGPIRMYPASTSPMILSLFGTVMNHPVVKKAAYICLSKADKTVLTIDGQFSIGTNVLCQVAHGTSECHQSKDHAQERHCIQTVRGVDSLLLARPRENEGLLDLLQSLLSATQGLQIDGVTQTGDVWLIFSDTPAKLDNHDVYAAFTILECIVT